MKDTQICLFRKWTYDAQSLMILESVYTPMKHTDGMVPGKCKYKMLMLANFSVAISSTYIPIKKNGRLNSIVHMIAYKSRFNIWI